MTDASRRVLAFGRHLYRFFYCGIIFGCHLWLMHLGAFLPLGATCNGSSTAVPVVGANCDWCTSVAPLIRIPRKASLFGCSRSSSSRLCRFRDIPSLSRGWVAVTLLGASRQGWPLLTCCRDRAKLGVSRWCWAVKETGLSRVGEEDPSATLTKQHQKITSI